MGDFADGLSPERRGARDPRLAHHPRRHGLPDHANEHRHGETPLARAGERLTPRRPCGKPRGSTREGRLRIPTATEMPTVRDAMRRHYCVLDRLFSLANPLHGEGEAVALEIVPVQDRALFTALPALHTIATFSTHRLRTLVLP